MRVILSLVLVVLGASETPCCAMGARSGRAGDASVRHEQVSGQRASGGSIGNPAPELSPAGTEESLQVRELGSSLNDLVFTPIATPCRIYDTRSGSGVQGQGLGPLAPGAVVSIDVAGGVATCGVPSPAAKAAVLNFVAVAASGPGDLRVWPWDQSNPGPPNASVLNFASQTALAGLNIANGVVVPICNTATATGGNCTHSLFLRSDISSTHVIIDVLGYLAAPMVTPLSCITITSLFGAHAGNYFDVDAPCGGTFTVTGGGLITNSGPNEGTYVKSSYPNGSNGWHCTGYNSASATGDWVGNCYAVCCQTPGR
jgi:hypothetical protein